MTQRSDRSDARDAIQEQVTDSDWKEFCDELDSYFTEWEDFCDESFYDELDCFMDGTDPMESDDPVTGDYIEHEPLEFETDVPDSSLADLLNPR